MTDFDVDNPSPEKARLEYQNFLNEFENSDDSEENTIHKLTKNISHMEPESLYRYRAVNTNNLEALLSDRLYFSEPQYFNDPFDCSFFVDINKARDELINKTNQRQNGEKSYYSQLSKDTVEDLLFKFDYRDTDNYLATLKYLLDLMGNEINNMKDFPNTIPFEYIIEKIHNTYFHKIRSNIGVVCLSETKISNLMWSHYADSHKGFVLEYDFDNSFKTEYSGILFPVIYTDKRCDITKQIINTMRGIIDDGKIDVLNRMDMIKISTYKGNEWGYEKEWRIISFNNAPYATIKPKAIYLGLGMSCTDKAIIHKVIEGKDLRIYQMYTDENEQEYSLNFKMI